MNMGRPRADIAEGRGGRMTEGPTGWVGDV